MEIKIDIEESNQIMYNKITFYQCTEKKTTGGIVQTDTAPCGEMRERIWQYR